MKEFIQKHKLFSFYTALMLVIVFIAIFAPWLAPGDAFTGNVKTTYASGNAIKLTEQDLKGTWTELAFGGRYGFNTNNSIYADVTTGLSGDYQADWGVNAGFTHKF